MMKPLRVFISGQEITGFTTFSCERKKENLTGSFNLTLFGGATPPTPMFTDIALNSDVLVYVGGHLVLTAKVDSRTGKGDAKNYTISVSGRGKTRRLIDSSHQHKTTNMVGPTTRDAVDTLIKPFNIGTEWLGSEIKLDKVRFRDGAPVLTELIRVATENAYFIYETRDGKLRVTDNVGPSTGEPLILGDNILSFSAVQTSEKSKSKIKVKGKRTKKEVWGEKAIIPTLEQVDDATINEFVPLTIQHYGDATPEALKRRAKFEADKRSADSKKIGVDVFHIQSRDGTPWDIGTLHYVEIPVEGVFNAFECTGVSYVVDVAGTLKTTLTLAPPPSSAVSDGTVVTSVLLTDVAGVITFAQRVAALNSIGTSRKPNNITGNYPSGWVGPKLTAAVVVNAVTTVMDTILNDDPLLAANNPTLTIPDLDAS